MHLQCFLSGCISAASKHLVNLSSPATHTYTLTNTHTHTQTHTTNQNSHGEPHDSVVPSQFRLLPQTYSIREATSPQRRLTGSLNWSVSMLRYVNLIWQIWKQNLTDCTHLQSLWCQAKFDDWQSLRRNWQHFLVTNMNVALGKSDLDRKQGGFMKNRMWCYSYISVGSLL